MGTKKGTKRPDTSKRNKLLFTGKSSWNKGLKGAQIMSDETKKKMSEVKKGKKPKNLGVTFGLSGVGNINWKGGHNSGTKRRNAPRPMPEQCETCGTFGKETKQGLCYDHCHTTGKFRGWLCNRCNVALGMVKDNSETLVALSEYLKKSRE